jgi:hypothetical protein
VIQLRAPRTILLSLLLCLALTAAYLVVDGDRAGAATGSWAPAATARIHPGVQTYTNGGNCTANFVYSDGANTYIGQAAHCASTGSNTDTDGCSTASLPLGTPVTILGAAHPGVLAYSSWLTMQRDHETDPDTCAYNDLALVRIDPADVATVNPSIPHWGGPTTLNTAGAPTGSSVYSYGNSILRLGVTLLSPKLGMSGGDVGGGWSHVVTTVTPGIPGDSGSAFLDASGAALGDLSTLGVGVPDGVVNNVSDLSRELNYLRAHESTTSLAALQLVLGTETFNPNQVPLDTAHPVDDPVGGLQNFFGLTTGASTRAR